MTRNRKWYGDGAERAGSLEEALDLAGDDAEVFVIGGAEIYAAALPFADELLLTEIDAEIEGDTLFPPIDGAVFEEVEREPHVLGGWPYLLLRPLRPARRRREQRRSSAPRAGAIRPGSRASTRPGPTAASTSPSTRRSSLRSS